MTIDVRDDIGADVRTWLKTQPSVEELVATMARVPSMPATLEQNVVTDMAYAIADTGTIEVDEFVPDWAELPSFTAPLDDQRLWCPLLPEDAYRDVLPELKAQVLTLDRGPGPTLMFNGHVDVVPVDGQEWSSPAFAPRVADGLLYARGATDMKGGVVAAALAFRFLAERWTGAGKIQLALVPEEETGGDGTLAVLHKGYIADAVVFTESTDLEIVHRHVGIQRFDVKVAGRPGGMLRRSQGVSAVGPTARIAIALEALEQERTERAYRAGGYSDDDLPGFINIVMNSGDWIATRAGHGSISALMGVLPGETQEEARAEIEATVQAVDSAAVVTSWDGGHRGSELERGHSLVTSFAVPGAADGPGSATRAGTMVCDAKIAQGGGWSSSIVLGPRGGNMHSADEWVDLDSVGRTVELLVAGAYEYMARGCDS